MNPLITSKTNPRIKQQVRLRNRREREQSQQFLIEGYREILRATEGKRYLEELYYCPELFLGTQENALIDAIAAEGTALYRVTKEVFEKISYRDRPDGLLAVAKQKHRNLTDLEQLLKTTPPFLIIAEAIEKPGNLGTILRSADAAGVDALIICDACTDIHNPNVVRASVGTLFTVPVIEASSEEAIEWLRKKQIAIVASTPQAKNLYTETPLHGPVAIAVGTEQYGLSPTWMQNADIQVRIPMHGRADSLNVATATTLLLFEGVRQRGSALQ